LEDSYNPAAAQEGYSKLDARIGLRAVDDAWEVALVGKNLTNKLTASHAFNTPTVAGLISQYIQPPRTFALQVKLSF
jgi:iron complex outermembrane receptor protein